jgi:hypothetical protein
LSFWTTLPSTVDHNGRERTAADPGDACGFVAHGDFVQHFLAGNVNHGDVIGIGHEQQGAIGRDVHEAV